MDAIAERMTAKGGPFAVGERATGNGSQQVGVGIKTVLTIAESARLAGSEPGQWFAEQLGEQIQRNNPRV